MKRLKKLLFIIIVIIIIMSVKNVKGASLDTVVRRNYIENVWSFHYRNGKVFSYGNMPINYANDRLAYCIQPETKVNFDIYNSYENWNISGYSEDAKRKMELYAYYGYGFKDHTDIKYYMATQDLIWRLSRDENIEWRVGNNTSTNEIDISRERNEILDLVNKHGILPSFNNITYNTYTGLDLTVVDTNNVLSSFDIVSNINYKKVGNNLVFNIDKLGTYEVLIKPILNGYENTIVYDREDSPTQDLATFKMPDIPSGKFYIKVDRVKVRINKKDKDTDELIIDEGNKVLINDIEYEFRNGVIETYLEKGEYTIKEINSSNGYYINPNEKKFTIEDNSSNKEIDFYNEKIRGRIDIKKTNEDNELLEGVIFEIYDNSNKLVDTITTSKNEYDSSKILPLGNYTLKEVKTLNGYKLDNRIYNVSLINKDNTESIILNKINLVNKKILCEITVITSDELSNRVNTKYEIYDKDMNIIYKGNTINGETKLFLTYGKYYIKEISIENGYILNDELKEFEVSDDFCLANITITNNKTIYPKSNTNYDIYPFIIVLLDIIGIIYVKKNS